MSPNRPFPRQNDMIGRVPWRGDDGPRAITTSELAPVACDSPENSPCANPNMTR